MGNIEYCFEVPSVTHQIREKQNSMKIINVSQCRKEPLFNIQQHINFIHISPKKGEDNPSISSIEEEEIVCPFEQFNRIQVQWNSFIKIKKKNYLQDYVYLKQIGRGAYGIVSKLKMKYSGLLRAGKIARTANINQKKDNKEKFFTEISIPMQLDHPNLIKIYQMYKWKEQFVIIMELCEGGDLFQCIKQKRIFSENKTAQIMKQILSAVYYLHKKNIAHRDLKPENILYDNESQTIKLIDFGTAFKFKSGQVMSNRVGTPYYLAPQVITGKYNELCDIWSCGIILYVLLCGSAPFNGQNQQQIMNKIINQPLQFSNGIWKNRSLCCKKLITQMLTKDPTTRITAYEALNSQWITNTPTILKQKQSDEEILNNLKHFHFKNKLKAVVYTFIASQLYSNNDKQELLKVFQKIDFDGDGVITRDQLISVFNKSSVSVSSNLQVERILQIVDTNSSGLIDFTQFLVAASNEQRILQIERLQNAFNYLDTDHSGQISMQEIKNFLDGTNETAEQIKNIFKQVDKNGDGFISKDQFIILLTKKNQ